VRHFMHHSVPHVCELIQNSRKFIYTALFFSLFTISAYASVDWPDLDSSSGDVQKTIISSVLGRVGEEYKGGQFHNNWFVVQGDDKPNADNKLLQKDLPLLRALLSHGHRIQLKPAGTPNEAGFTYHTAYNIFVDGTLWTHRAELYNRSKLADFYSFNAQPCPAYLGHGLRTDGALSNELICHYMFKYSDNPVLSRAFAIMEGADLAIALDVKKLQDGILANAAVNVDLETLLEIMRSDRNKITQAANLLRGSNVFNGVEEAIYRPLIDQLHALGNQEALCGYKSRKGIDGAIILLRAHPGLLRGEIPAALKRVTGKDANHLRLALFYVDLQKKKIVGASLFNLDTLKSFYKGTYLGPNDVCKALLSQTHFFQGNAFYAPDGYIKNGDFSVQLLSADANTVSVRLQAQRNALPLRNVITDCSGFAQFVARQFHPANRRLNNVRQMSYQLAAVYDAYANEQKHTTKRMYNFKGQSARALTDKEAKYLNKFSQTIADLRTVYAPVLNPLQNIQPGDIVIEQRPGEGHVMICVEQNAHNKNKLVIIECTGFGKSRGYKWREIDISGASTYRVLRIKL
jgi:hypothetical protein